MIEIAPCKDRLEELVSFVARLNSDGTHHIGYFGEGEADVRASLAECLIPTENGFRLAREGETLVGVFGVDADPEINRAWLLGPLVEHDDWHTIADQLYARVLPLIPPDIGEYELFCDVQNVNVQAFALRHGFPLNSENALMVLDRANYRPVATRQTQVVLYRGEFFERLERLHRNIFPNAYYTARQMVEKLGDTRRLILAVEGQRLLGFHFCKIDPEAQSGYVDFIGTDSAARGRGVGADLLAAGIDWMLSAPSTHTVHLTVNADNAAARALYERFGFVTDRTMRGYRKRVI